MDPEKARELKKLKQAEQKRLEALKRRQEKEEEKRKLEEGNLKQEQLNKQIQQELENKEEKRRWLKFFCDLTLTSFFVSGIFFQNN